MSWVIISGDVINGLILTGPFEEAHIANEYAECFIKNSDWLVAELEDPDEELLADLTEEEEAHDVDPDGCPPVNN